MNQLLSANSGQFILGTRHYLVAHCDLYAVVTNESCRWCLDAEAHGVAPILQSEVLIISSEDMPQLDSVRHPNELPGKAVSCSGLDGNQDQDPCLTIRVFEEYEVSHFLINFFDGNKEGSMGKISITAGARISDQKTVLFSGSSVFTFNGIAIKSSSEKEARKVAKAYIDVDKFAFQMNPEPKFSFFTHPE